MRAMKTKKHSFFIGAPLLGIVLLVLGNLFSCDPVQELAKVDIGDVSPPELLSQEITDAGTIQLDFSENIELVPDSLHFSQGPSTAVQGQANQHPAPNISRQVKAGSRSLEDQHELVLHIDCPTEPGREYAVEVAVRDNAGNSLTLVLPFYGPNPHPASLCLNELLTKSSTKNRDCIEILVTANGNLGGETVFLGVSDDYDACFTFPAIAVKAGDFVLLHCKPEGIAAEIDEIGSIEQSGGLNASSTARDFWWRDAPGLPDDTGIVTVANNPLGHIKDAVFYSNKVTVAGKDYRSFGTKKLLDRAEKLVASQAWKSREGAIAVEDAAVSTGLTSTRSLCRDASSTDSNQATDWHIVPSSQASLGVPNSEERYTAPVKPD